MSLVDPNRKSAEELYGDIINLSRPESIKHKRMNPIDRAAQFAPFAALTGYEDAVDETARLTGSRLEISEERKSDINRKIRILLGYDRTEDKLPTIIIYYLPDKYKDGGSYVSCNAEVKKYDSENNLLIMNDGNRIKVDDIFDIR